MKKNNRFKLDTYKEGGNKSEWISNKISEIMKEGKYPQDQAIAIAYSMYNEKYQDGGINSNLKNIYNIKQGVYNPSMGEGFQILYRDPSDPKFNPDTDVEFVKRENLKTVQGTKSYKDFMNRQATNGQFTPTQLYGEYETPKFATQKRIENIKRDVRTEGVRQGMPAGEYTKIYYSDGTVDYIDKKGEPTLQQMSNYREYMKRQASPQLQSGSEIVAQYQNGGGKDLSFSTEIDNSPILKPKTEQEYAESLKGSMITPWGENLRFNASQNTVGQTSPFDTTGEMKPTSQEAKQSTTYTQPPQFLNPYVDVDIESGAQAFGRGLQSGNAFDIVAGGLKTAVGTARNIFSGMGQEKIKNEALKTYYQNQRDTLTKPEESYKEGGYYQNGGVQSQQEEIQEGSTSNPQEEQGEVSQEQVVQQIAQALQQGVDPNQVIQQLMQMGVPQDQAVQMVQGVMQQLQPQTQEQPVMQNGGEYLNKLVGKKIKNYSYNNQTGNYDIEFE